MAVRYTRTLRLSSYRSHLWWSCCLYKKRTYLWDLKKNCLYFTWVFFKAEIIILLQTWSIICGHSSTVKFDYWLKSISMKFGINVDLNYKKKTKASFFFLNSTQRSYITYWSIVVYHVSLLLLTTFCGFRYDSNNLYHTERRHVFDSRRFYI